MSANKEKGGARRPLEILAPAGDRAALDAALMSGADSVYFGATMLSARGTARNFAPSEIPAAVSACHAAGAKAYLALNIDLAEGELASAMRLLLLARDSGADAVIFRDPAILAMRPAVEGLDFHLSTQAGACSSAELLAAASLGVSRVILAREMSLSEIKEASAAAPGVETEVFVQGSLCCSVSGRCLLSSWGGGRSGNRGLCASPCRLPWRVDGQDAGTPLSMEDLGLAGRLAELSRAGVTALKIEGRLKTAAWVRDAVTLFVRAREGAPAEEIREASARLGDYTGRRVGSGYLDGRRGGLTGTWGRAGGEPEKEASPVAEAESDASGREAPAEVPAGKAEPCGYSLEINKGPRGLDCSFSFSGRGTRWIQPHSVVSFRRREEAVSLAEFLESLKVSDIHGHRLSLASTDSPDSSLAPSTVRKLVERLSGLLHGAARRRDRDGASIPEEAMRLLAKTSTNGANTQVLGGRPGWARLRASQFSAFVKSGAEADVVVEGASEKDVAELLGLSGGRRMVFALPAVMYEAELPKAYSLSKACSEQGVPVEANSLGGLFIARSSGAIIEAGPGLSVLNSLAVRTLAGMGAGKVTLSVEADRHKLDALRRSCGLPATLVVYGRPVLLMTRAQLPGELVGKSWEDRRGLLRLESFRESGFVVLRPVEPFDISGRREEDIHVARLCADLVTSRDAVAEWRALSGLRSAAFAFNFDRGLE